MDSVKFNINPRYASNLSMVVFNDTNGLSKFNLTGTQLVDFKRTFLMFNVAFKSNEASKTFDKEVYKGTADVCILTKGFFGNLIVRNMVEILDSYSNFKLECPQKKGFIYVYNYPMDSDRYYPKFMFLTPRSYEFTVVLKAKIENVRATALVVTIKFYGRISI